LFNWRQSLLLKNMGLFSRKKKEDKKTDDVKKTSKVDSGKKEPRKQSMKDLYTNKGKKIKESKEGQSRTGMKAPEGKEKKGAQDVKKIKRHGSAYKVLVKPLITEKASDLGALNKYVFAVKKDANKIEVAKAIDEVYGIKPLSVNIIKMKGKNVRYGRTSGRKKDWKKAIITLPAGKTIKIYEGV